MFLATTALSEFWDQEQELFFLGTWCLLPERQQEWSRLRYRVLPCPWNDRARFYHSAVTTAAAYERILPEFVEYLNQAHGSSFTVKYWRIVAGPWLWQFINAVVDRLAHLSDALEASQQLSSLGLSPGVVGPSQDSRHLVQLLTDDPYNLQLCSDLLRALGHPPVVRPLAPEDALKTSNAYRPPRTVKERLRLTSRRAWLRLCRRRWDVALCEMYMPQSAVRTLSVRSSLRMLRADIPRYLSTPLSAVLDWGRRAQLGNLGGRQGLDRIVFDLLPRHLPPLYLENFSVARAEVIAREPALPAVTVTGVGWLFNEPFKFLAAEASRRGGRLVTAQHGGGYGYFRHHTAEAHERAVSDTFLSWGWATAETAGCRNLCNPKLSRLTAAGTDAINEGRPVLFVSTDHPRYMFRFHSMPVGSQWSDFAEWERRFFEALPERFHPSVVFRPGVEDCGHGLVANIQHNFPSIRIDRTAPFEQSLERASLVVIDHCSTTWLQALAANVPTVLFWDPDRWEARPEAEPYVEMLRDAGILFANPEDAAAQVAVVHHSSRNWWLQHNVQAARSAFVARYAATSPDWADEWIGALQDEVALAGRSGSAS